MKLKLPLPLGDFPAIKFESFVLLFGGGSGEQVIDTIWKHDLKAGEITEYAKMPYPSRGHQVLLFGENCYLLGGFDGQLTTNSVFRFEIKSRKWTKLNDMPVDNGWFGATVFDDKIYVLGGFSIPVGYWSSIYVYFPDKDNWEERKDAFPGSIYPKRVLGSQSVVVVNEYIYNFGGADSFNKRTVSINIPSIVSRYNPQKREWDILSSEGYIATESSPSIYEARRIFISAGFSPKGVINKIQIYNLELNKFEKAISLAEARVGAPLVFHENRLFIYGGVIDPLYKMTSNIEVINV